MSREGLLQAAKQALEALEYIHTETSQDEDELIHPAITALRHELEKPADEPMQEHSMKDVRCECCGYMTYHREHMGCIRASRPQPAHEPLTDEQIDEIWNRYCDEMGEASINDAHDIARAIEAAHGIKEKNT